MHSIFSCAVRTYIHLGVSSVLLFGRSIWQPQPFKVLSEDSLHACESTTYDNSQNYSKPLRCVSRPVVKGGAVKIAGACLLAYYGCAVQVALTVEPGRRMAQAVFRGSQARSQFSSLLLRTSAAEDIQRAARGYLARKRAIALRLQRNVGISHFRIVSRTNVHNVMKFSVHVVIVG